jgi:hypothetical protein
MFGLVDDEEKERQQRVDKARIDELIEGKIKECRRENGECMKSTSGRLRIMYGTRPVDRVLSRLKARRYRNNKNNRDTLHNILDSFSI